MKKIWLIICSCCLILFLSRTAGAVPIEDVIPVPEPTTLLLLSVGLLGIGVLGKKRFKK